MMDWLKHQAEDSGCRQNFGAHRFYLLDLQSNNFRALAF